MIKASKLTEGIKKEYFAKAEGDDSPEVIISTDNGMIVTLLIRHSSCYLFVLLGENGELPMETDIPLGVSWVIEKSSDGKSGTLVSEVFFNPDDMGDIEKSLPR